VDIRSAETSLVEEHINSLGLKVTASRGARAGRGQVRRRTRPLATARSGHVVTAAVNGVNVRFVLDTSLLRLLVPWSSRAGCPRPIFSRLRWWAWRMAAFPSKSPLG